MRRSIALLTGVVLFAAAAIAAPSLSNGIYAVLGEGSTREEVRTDKVPHTVLAYEQKYIALDTSSFVPLILSGSPEAEKDARGWTMLRVVLAPEHVKTLEVFTRAHLNGKVAIVIGGEIITMHKVRSVISDGKVQITRCNDDACQKLLLQLTKK